MSCKSGTETYLCTELKPETEEIVQFLREVPEEVKRDILGQLKGAKLLAQILNPDGDKRSA